MRYLIPLLLLTAWLSAANAQDTVDTIGFGSCAAQNQKQPIWLAILEARPDVFIMLGDNIYADTEDMQVMQKKYDQLAAIPGFAALREKTTLLATWDDHDYGKNDAGAEYPMKKDAEKIFEDFFQFPEDHPARKRDGVYSAREFGPEDRRIQIILLDTRYFRTELASEKVRGRKVYVPVEGERVTLLGDEQWKWLEQELKKPARLRIIASSIQFVPEEHPYEKWANMPQERERLIHLIHKTRANGVVMVSGDRHLAEISKLETDHYPLYDVTSSALNRSSGGSSNETNRHRIEGGNYRANNFGWIEMDWDQPDPLIRMQIRSETGEVVRNLEVPLSALQ